MTTDLIRRCAAAAGLDATALLVDGRGLQNLVLIDLSRDVVARFPRDHRGCSRLGDAAVRLRRLAQHGLPVPRVLDVREEGGPGRAHLTMTRVTGAPLDEVETDALPAAARARLVGDLVRLGERLDAFPVAEWPSPSPDWVELWGRLSDAVASDQESTADDRARCRRALRTARQAPIGLFHGDLGGVNCRVDTETGAVTGVLDWDSASIGDTATDRVALLWGVGPRTAAQLRAQAPSWALAERRYRAYVETWPVQERLWKRRRHPLSQVSPGPSTSATARRTVSDP